MFASIPTIPALLKKCGIADWDALIIGDGSGSGWSLGLGWAAVLIDRYSRAGKLFYGAINVGTVTLAEFLPYLYALNWYGGDDGPGKSRLKQAMTEQRSLQIHIITDSEITATVGNNPESRKKHYQMWAALDAWRSSGYEITFHFVPRDVTPLNIFVDAVSRQARIDLTKTRERAIEALQHKYPGIPEGVSFYDFIAWTE